MSSTYDKILEDVCKDNDLDVSLVRKIIQINELSDINSSAEQVQRKREIGKILDQYLES